MDAYTYMCMIRAFIRIQHAFVCTLIYLQYITCTNDRVGLYIHTINIVMCVYVYIMCRYIDMYMYV